MINTAIFESFLLDLLVGLLCFFLPLFIIALAYIVTMLIEKCLDIR